MPLQENRIALTFDDGPNPEATPRLLDLLDVYGVKATFFLLGKNVARYPKLAAEIAIRRHEIGNHTQNHMLLPILPRAILVRELDRASHVIQEATGKRPNLFRPPMGWFSRGMLHTLAKHGYRAILGDVHPQDSNRPGAEVIANRVLDRVGPGSIVILHDGGIFGAADRNQSVDAVEMLITRLRSRQYEFDTVSQLVQASEREAAAQATPKTTALAPTPQYSASPEASHRLSP